MPEPVFVCIMKYWPQGFFLYVERHVSITSCYKRCDCSGGFCSIVPVLIWVNLRNDVGVILYIVYIYIVLSLSLLG